MTSGTGWLTWSAASWLVALLFLSFLPGLVPSPACIYSTCNTHLCRLLEWKTRTILRMACTARRSSICPSCSSGSHVVSSTTTFTIWMPKFPAFACDPAMRLPPRTCLRKSTTWTWWMVSTCCSSMFGTRMACVFSMPSRPSEVFIQRIHYLTLILLVTVYYFLSPGFLWWRLIYLFFMVDVFAF